MCKCLKFSNAILYADDTTIFIVGHSLKFMKTKMHHDLAWLSEWLRLNNLKLNVRKTKCILFNKQGLLPNVHLMIDNEEIQTVETFKFLGVYLDCNLSFETHYKELHLRLLKSGSVIRSLAKILPCSCLRNLYFTYFNSHLTYAATVWWSFLRKQQQDNLYLLQKRIIRSICNAPFRSHCMPIFKKLSILSIWDQMLLENCKLVFNIESDKCPISVLNLYGKQQSVYNTREFKFAAPLHKSRRVNVSFLCKPISDWRRLPRNIRQIENIRTFTKGLKKELLDKY